MAGRIRTEDVQAVKERTSIEDVVREHVTLRPAGTGALKGLCPFHDEKTPSFNIRPAVGSWHCFGCDEGGDVISFVMKIDHLTFAEAVERLAGRLGMELRYDETPGPGGRREEGGLGRRARLVEAHRAAAEFYHQQLVDTAEGRAARDFLRAKDFRGEAARTFQVGYSPQSGDALTRHLRDKGFTDDELIVAGLAGRSSRGLYDRFRGRVMWPIRDITGDTIGFGARRLYDHDRIAAKYLNTAETPIYRKQTVLYGLDLAKKAMANERRAVVVEGYTDVMACHLAGVETAVATCGTAFGTDHIKMLRRILRDEAGLAPARVVFTFDGDAAGQKAAMRAFEQDQQWASQSYVAIAPAGQDPNELLQSAGGQAVRDLIDEAVPMFEFAARTTMAPFDLDHPEQRVRAMRAVAPIIARIRDRSLRPEYTRTVAGWLGVGVEQLGSEVARAARSATRDRTGGPPAPGDAGAGPGAGRGTDGTGAGRGRDGSGDAAEEPLPPPMPPPDLRDPLVRAERELLQVCLQHPASVAPSDLDNLPDTALRAPMHRAVLHGIRAAGGLPAAASLSASAWTAAVAERTAPAAQALVHELVVAPLPMIPEADGRPPQRYVSSLLVRVVETDLTRRIDEALSALQRAQDGPESRRINEELTALHRQRVELRARTE